VAEDSQDDLEALETRMLWQKMPVQDNITSVFGIFNGMDRIGWKDETG